MNEAGLIEILGKGTDKKYKLKWTTKETRAIWKTDMARVSFWLEMFNPVASFLDNPSQGGTAHGIDDKVIKIT